MKFEDVSDFQVNKYVADSLGLVTEGHEHEQVLLYEGTPLDYCNDPSDWGQLMVDHNISLYCQSIREDGRSRYGAREDGFSPTCYREDKPGRAVAKCLIMMKTTFEQE